jgi:hypothetical protein
MSAPGRAGYAGIRDPGRSGFVPSLQFFAFRRNKSNDDARILTPEADDLKTHPDGFDDYGVRVVIAAYFSDSMQQRPDFDPVESASNLSNATRLDPTGFGCP